MPKMLIRLLSILLALAACYSASSVRTARAGDFTSPVTIDITDLTPFLDTLPPDEKDEQLRDWALYALKSSLGLSSAGEMPVRHQALKNSRKTEVSVARVFVISQKEWGVVAAPETLKNRPLIGSLIDRRYAACNCLPEKVRLFSYASGPKTKISITSAGVINAKDIFSSQYGYYSATVSSSAELSSFLSRIDDLVSIQMQPAGIAMAGRKYSRGSERSVTMEDMAVLYQSYNTPEAPGRTKKKQSLGNEDSHMGFSLDQEVAYNALAGELRAFAEPHNASSVTSDPSFPALIKKHSNDLLTAADSLQKRRDMQPFLSLRKMYEKSNIPAEGRFSEALRRMDNRNTFHAANYDGKLQGTSAGMILFYTDLLAKLWMLDYQGSAPRSVKGFRTIDQISVPKTYWADLPRLAKTRLWFGLRKEGFNIYGNRVLFQPVVTRVYAASSDPMKPGKESRPNYQSEEFLGWWDRHYETVAAVEPYYYKLDQLQKWSAVFLVLKEKRSRTLDFLMNVPVRRNIDFETWSRSEPGIAKIKFPFLDRNRYGCQSECIPMLSSNRFKLMGGDFVLSGGVSLASRKDILPKLQEHASASKGKTSVSEDSAEMPNPDRTYGNFSAEKKRDLIRLNWTKGPSMAAYELVSSLAAAQEARSRGYQGEEIFGSVSGITTVVRVKKWNTYLVKTAASGGSWIYLALNPAKTAEFQASAAAAIQEADIFCAKPLSDDQARKLAAGKPVIR